MTAPRPVVLVTGAGQRVGRAIAVHLADRGYDVALHHHRSAEGARDAAADCTAAGARAECFGADLADPSNAGALIASVAGAFGHLDALVNSAAIMMTTPLDSVAPAEWDQIFAVNLRAPFFLSLAAHRAMSGGGAIVNIADHLAEESSPGLVPHGISKAAVVAMTTHLAVQFAPRIRVNAVSPGAVLPPEGWPAAARDRFVRDTPLGRIGTPRDVAGAVEYLLSAPYVTGHVLVVDGGRRLR
jgi:pteridine reductase